MLASKNSLHRRLQIVELVRKRGEVSVDELSQAFDVSSVTIRSDLSYLEAQRYLVRSFGKARYLEQRSAASMLADRHAERRPQIHRYGDRPRRGRFHRRPRVAFHRRRRHHAQGPAARRGSLESGAHAPRSRDGRDRPALRALRIAAHRRRARRRLDDSHRPRRGALGRVPAARSRADRSERYRSRRQSRSAPTRALRR